jgi:pyridoxine 4-dehydrogenase
MATPKTISLPAAAAGTITLGGVLTVNQMGFGAMRLTGSGVWGPPRDRAEAIRVLQRVAAAEIRLAEKDMVELDRIGG